MCPISSIQCANYTANVEDSTLDSPQEEPVLIAHKHPPNYHWQLWYQIHQVLYLQGDRFTFRVVRGKFVWFHFLASKILQYSLNFMSTLAAFKRFWRFSSDSVFLSLRRFSWNKCFIFNQTNQPKPVWPALCGTKETMVTPRNIPCRKTGTSSCVFLIEDAQLVFLLCMIPTCI